MQDKKRYSLYLNNIELNSNITLKKMHQITKIDYTVILNDLSNFDILIKIFDEFNLKFIESDLRRYIHNTRFFSIPFLNITESLPFKNYKKIISEVEEQDLEELPNFIINNKTDQSTIEKTQNEIESFFIERMKETSDDVNIDFDSAIYLPLIKKNRIKKKTIKNYNIELEKFILENFCDQYGNLNKDLQLTQEQAKKLRYIITKIIYNSTL